MPIRTTSTTATRRRKRCRDQQPRHRRPARSSGVPGRDPDRRPGLVQRRFRSERPEWTWDAHYRYDGRSQCRRRRGLWRGITREGPGAASLWCPVLRYLSHRQRDSRRRGLSQHGGNESEPERILGIFGRGRRDYLRHGQERARDCFGRK
jgi:hypothetical protein